MARRSAPLDAEILGMADLNRAARAVPKLAKRELTALVAASASAVEARAFQLVHHREGDLARAIGQSGVGVNRRVGIDKEASGSRGGASSHPYPAIYGHFVEYGTNDTGAYPFMRPAADEEEARFTARVREVAATLERAAARGGKGV